MSKQIALYPEQMKHLEELGLDTSDADLIWEKNNVNSSCSHLTVNHLCRYEIELFLSSYAYTLQDILEKLHPFSRQQVIRHSPNEWLDTAYDLLCFELTHKEDYK